MNKKIISILLISLLVSISTVTAVNNSKALKETEMQLFNIKTKNEIIEKTRSIGEKTIENLNILVNEEPSVLIRILRIQLAILLILPSLIPAIILTTIFSFIGGPLLILYKTIFRILISLNGDEKLEEIYLEGLIKAFAFYLRSYLPLVVLLSVIISGGKISLIESWNYYFGCNPKLNTGG